MISRHTACRSADSQPGAFIGNGVAVLVGVGVLVGIVRPQSIWDKSEPKLREYFSLRIERPRPFAMSSQVPLSSVS